MAAARSGNHSTFPLFDDSGLDDPILALPSHLSLAPPKLVSSSHTRQEQSSVYQSSLSPVHHRYEYSYTSNSHEAHQDTRAGFNGVSPIKPVDNGLGHDGSRERDLLFEYETRLSTHDALVTDLRQKLEKITREKEDAVNQLWELQRNEQTSGQQRAETQHLDVLYSSLQRQHATLQSEHDACVRRIAELNDELAGQRHEADHEGVQLQIQAAKEAARAQERVTALQAELDTLRSRASSNEQLRAEAMRLQAAASETAGRAQDLQGQAARAAAAAEAATSDLGVARQQLEEARLTSLRERESLRAALQRAREETASLQRDLAAATAQAGSQGQQRELAASELTQQRAAVAQAQRQLTEVQRERQRLAAEVESLQTRVHSSEMHSVQHTETIHTMTMETQRLRQELEASTGQSRAQLAELERSNAGLRNELSQLQQRSEEQRARQASELESRARGLQTTEMELVGLRETVRQLQTSDQHKSQELLSLRSDLDAARVRNHIKT